VLLAGVLGLPDEPPGIDIAAGLPHARLDAAAYHGLLLRLRDGSCGEFLSTFAACEAVGDRDGSARTLHTLKGLAQLGGSAPPAA
jgi:hypothetical protein